MHSTIETLKEWLKRTPKGAERINRMYETKLQEQRRLAKENIKNKY